VDFAKHIIRVRQSVDAATRTVCGVKIEGQQRGPA
jgi:hypothetical protein